MTELSFGLSSYSRADGRLPSLRLINWLSEQAPTTETGLILLPRWGMAPLFDLPNVRGLYREDGVVGGSLLTISDQTLFVNDEAVDDVPGTDKVEWAYTLDGLFLLSGGIVYETDGDTVTASELPDGVLASSLAQIDGILLASHRDTQEIFFRLPGDTTWAALDKIVAVREPDPVLALRSLADLLWVFGSSSIEPFAPTGDIEAPLQRLDGASINRGCKDRDSIVQADNTLIFVGEDNIVYRLSNVPERISDHGIEERMGLSVTCSAWSYVQDGHTIVVFNLDAETLAYDLSNGKWIQFKYAANRFINLGIYDGRKTYVGGAKVWTLESRANDDGEELERLFTSLAPTKRPVSCDALQVSLSPGVAQIGDPSATLQTRWSDDQGRTWKGWREASTGEGGQYRKRIIYRRLGMIDAPGRVFEHRITDDVNVRVSGVEMNPPTGGRARP